MHPWRDPPGFVIRMSNSSFGARAAAAGIMALFLALVVLAFYLGARGAPAHPAGIINREINGLEFIRKSLEYTFTGLGALSGAGAGCCCLCRKHVPARSVQVLTMRRGGCCSLFPMRRAEPRGEGGKAAVWHAADCKKDAIPSCHAGCNPATSSATTQQVPCCGEHRGRSCRSLTGRCSILILRRLAVV